jgi:hypothetical protein
MPTANFTMPLVSPWDDIYVKHTWIDVPQNWESLGTPSSNAAIDLHIALVPQYENALIDALYEVSTPGHPKHVHFMTPLHTLLYLKATPFQVWCAPDESGGFKARHTAP